MITNDLVWLGESCHPDKNDPYGMWRSLVAHTHGVRGVAGSNPVIPTSRCLTLMKLGFFVSLKIMMTRYFSYFFLLQVLFACGQPDVTISTPDHKSYTIEVIVPDLEIPWGMAFLPDNSLLITEKEGQLIHFQNGQKTIIQNVPNTYVRGQGGLMGIAIHPNYKDNNTIYFTQSTSCLLYTSPSPRDRQKSRMPSSA